MNRRITSAAITITLLVPTTAIGQTSAETSAKEESIISINYCRNGGERFEQGESACLLVGERAMLATCEMAINNPTWRNTGEECDPKVHNISQ